MLERSLTALALLSEIGVRSLRNALFFWIISRLSNRLLLGVDVLALAPRSFRNCIWL